MKSHLAGKRQNINKEYSFIGPININTSLNGIT
jgi:hypothetical protein